MNCEEAGEISEITHVIGSTKKYGYLLEEGVDIPSLGILLGGVVDRKSGEMEEPHYLVTVAWGEDGLVWVKAQLSPLELHSNVCMQGAMMNE